MVGWKRRKALGELWIQRIHVPNPPPCAHRDLFLEQRVEHDGGAPRIFEPLDRVEVPAER
jgi:hypothetical protein